MANQWLRLWHDMPTDPKWRTIARISKQPIALVQAAYLHLLVEASRNVTRGHADVTPEDLASALDVTDEAIDAVLSAMQGRVLEGMYLMGWEKRQPKREDHGDEITGAKSPAQRQAERRARLKAEAESRDVTQSHDWSRDVTTDKDKEKIREEEGIGKHTSESCVTFSTDPALVCKAMKDAGIADVNPGNQKLRTLLEAGAHLDEFVGAAKKAADDSKGFAYALGIVANARREVAQLAQQIHTGAMPAKKPGGKFSAAAATIFGSNATQEYVDA